MFGFIKKLFGPPTDYKKLLSEGAIIIDVRTIGEFNSGSIKGSKNIPVDQIKTKLPEIKKTGKSVILVCRSGARAGMAKNILKSAGIDAYNGGSWNGLQFKIS